MANITFAKGASSVTIRGPLFPYQPTTTKAKALLRTQGGDVQVQTKSTVEVTTWALRFQNLTTAQRNNLYTFWQSVIDGPDELFTYTDPDSVEYENCRCLDTEFPFQMDMEGRWSGTWNMEMAT